MKIKIPTIKERKITRHTIAARCLGNLNLVFKKVKTGSSNTANKKASKTGVRISFPVQKIKAKQIKVTSIKDSFA
ncbi:hypothetical protein GCM10022423_03540 [Flavobacterium ginsengiterrae]|uniref:Ribosomal protein L28 n=1 Tax=Flavobacterium ginsengiterrae TaxID=871695 RepID=A0ABP7G9S0_9FLAO